MSRSILHQTIIAMATVLMVNCTTKADYNYISVEAPFPMPDIPVFNYPDRDFMITDFGAIDDSQGGCDDCLDANTKAFRNAMQACHDAGGGRVVVPNGEWSTGPIHFMSNCNLYLSEGATIHFTDDPERYLPEVITSWEGMECMNYSPLIYAYQCDNIAITGKGKLLAKMDVWRVWFKRPQPHKEALARLYDWAAFDEPVENRHMAVGESHLRPHFIHFNQCTNILLDGFRLRHSPFWTIHLFRCENAVARNLDVYAHGHNNDGIDIEMTRNVLIEDCVFDQGDDAVVIKAGRNQDAWRIGRPTENVVARNCRVINGHGLLVCGSEISGGLRNIYMHDCTMEDKVYNLFYIKTNHRRGAFVENIYMERVKANHMERAFNIDTDIVYQWKDMPTYKDSITQIRNIYMSDVQCITADGIVYINGDERLPVENINIEKIHIDTVYKYIDDVKNAKDVNTKDITYGAFLGEEN